MFAIAIFASVASSTGNIISPPFSLRGNRGKFSSIRSGSFISLSDFRSSVDFQSLMVQYPKLFFLNSRDVVEDLMTLLGVSRSEAVANLLNYNQPEIDAALNHILKVSNDVEVMLAMSNPLSVSGESFYEPISKVVEDYVALKRTRCLLRSLPRGLQGDAYDQYFTPVDGYRLHAKGTEGIVAMLIDEDASAWNDSFIYTQQLDFSLRTRTLTLQRSSASHPEGITRFIDLRAGCAVDLNAPYRFGMIVPEFGMLMLQDTSTNNLLIWRKDSIGFLSLPLIHTRAQMYEAHLSAERDNLVIRLRGSRWIILPTVTTLPFEPHIFPNNTLSENDQYKSLEPLSQLPRQQYIETDNGLITKVGDTLFVLQANAAYLAAVLFDVMQQTKGLNIRRAPRCVTTAFNYIATQDISLALLALRELPVDVTDREALTAYLVSLFA